MKFLDGKASFNRFLRENTILQWVSGFYRNTLSLVWIMKNFPTHLEQRNKIALVKILLRIL